MCLFDSKKIMTFGLVLEIVVFLDNFVHLSGIRYISIDSSLF